MKILNALRAVLVALCLSSPALAGPPAIPPSAPVTSAYLTNTLKASPVYTGEIATRAGSNYLSNAGYTHQMSRSMHIMKERVPSLQLVFYNGVMGPSGLGGFGATATFTASIEYPAGTCKQVKFSGSASGTAASSTLLVSDPVAVSIPLNAQFWVRYYMTGAGGIYYASPSTATGFPDTLDLVSADLTASCAALTSFGSGYAAYPQAIIGQTNKPSVYIYGDSRDRGNSETSTDALADLGQAAKFVGPAYAYINNSTPTGVAYNAAVYQASPVMSQLASYTTHAIDGYGINDLNNSRSAAQLIADRNTIDAALASSVKSGIVFGETVVPYTTSTDAWITTLNQTLKSYEAIRQSFNGSVRAGGTLTNEKYILDFDYAYDPAATGKWPVGTYLGLATGAANTPDGLHPNTAALQFLKQYTPQKPLQLIW